MFFEIFIKKFNCNVGYSGHEVGLAVSYAAAALGITALERHITLDRASWGTDQSASLGEEGIKDLYNIISKTPKALGDGIKRFSKEERQISKKFRYWN